MFARAKGGAEMAGWIETYRGVVNAWETDVVDHFTVAYYFDRFADASLGIMEHLGLGPSYIAAENKTCASVDCYVRYLHELRAGDAFHILSAPIEVSAKGLKLGHKVIDSASGTLCASMEQFVLHFDTAARKAVPLSARQLTWLKGQIAAWDGEPRQPRPEPEDGPAFIDSARDSTKNWEIDLLGHVGFQFHVHRFSAGALQFMAAIGLTPEFMREAKRGFSTFEFQMRFRRELKAGQFVKVRTALTHLGGSSLCMLHRMFDAKSGEAVAQLSQFGVLLDMAARRPVRLPDDIRARAEARLAKAA